jgi:SPP1 gp7 family putative phage head morphogenesis protein
MKKPKHFRPSRSAETAFERALRKVGRHAGHIVEAHVDGVKLHDEPGMQAALRAYAKLIDPWAKRQAAKMLEKVSKSNRKAYVNKARLLKQSTQMGKLLKLNVAEADVGRVAAALMDEQVELIKSIPAKAGLRAQKLSIEAVYSGTRASEIAEALKKSTSVSESTALLIARTEVARANASITQARATAIGSHWYIWRTTMDGAERDSHAEMNGEHVKYSEPPTLSDGTKGHAGTFPNCRCYQDVQFDDAEFESTA